MTNLSKPPFFFVQSATTAAATTLAELSGENGLAEEPLRVVPGRKSRDISGDWQLLFAVLAKRNPPRRLTIKNLCQLLPIMRRHSSNLVTYQE
jgi:hypothetical protein